MTADDIVRANELALDRKSRPDRSLLEAAAARPATSAGGVDAYSTIHSKAAALFHAIVRDHPFQDGNKRTAVLATFTFYALNGWGVEATQDEVIDLAVGTAAGELTIEDIEKRMTEWALPLSGDGEEAQ